MKYIIFTGLTFIALLGASAPAPAAAAPASAVVIATTPDGALIIEGQKYATAAAVKAKLAEVDRRRPRPALVLSANDSKDLESMMFAIKVAQRMGVPKIGFLVEPKSK